MERLKTERIEGDPRVAKEVSEINAEKKNVDRKFCGIEKKRSDGVRRAPDSTELASTTFISTTKR